MSAGRHRAAPASSPWSTLLLALLAAAALMAGSVAYAQQAGTPDSATQAGKKDAESKKAKGAKGKKVKAAGNEEKAEKAEKEEEEEKEKEWTVQQIQGAFHTFHIREMELFCGDCHNRPEEAEGRESLAFSLRPEHEACADCHDVMETIGEEKSGEEMPETGVCGMCHVGKGSGDDLGPFPSGQLVLGAFSHAQHADQRAPAHPETGVRQDCYFCHQVEPGKADPRRARHPQCGACHAGDDAASPSLEDPDEVEECLSCHALERLDGNVRISRPAGPRRHQATASGPFGLMRVGQILPPTERPYRDQLPFDHGRHLRTADGKPIACITCHQSVTGKTDPAQLSSRPTMRECATCHDNGALVGDKALISNCEICHAVVRADLRPRAADPVSSAVVHSEQFRMHHEAQAGDPERQCKFCHTATRDVLNDGCAGCHASMRPRSHNDPRFSEMPHGRLAVFDRRSCTQCHTADSCARCHNRAPRTHFPLSAFAGDDGGSHRILATINLRSCFACHTYEADCARCHVRALRE